MNEIFDSIDKFFTSLNNYLTFNWIMVGAIGLFLFTILCVFISTANSYEVRLIKSIDMFNNYFLNNPQINEETLVPFNNKMKSHVVPRQLRKQWQQYVLYREEKASHYMSFENCVSTPIKNSTYKRDIATMNSICYILVFASLLLGLYNTESTSLSIILQRALLTPTILLLLNFIVSIFLNVRHNAVVSDLNTNYQYFEVNIDKATETLPDYVDYEVLFDKNEIKRGIPILYAYLQKRAEEEQRELERARLKNVEHEKFNFDEAGVESSLVLDRAMQEAENYIAERKKYLEDVEQINSAITQEELNFRETTKEYQRQMQVSKESFDNFKQQLEQASSTIEANYTKKQQQQELDRQRNLERDYDTATDRHKSVLENYQAELTNLENDIKGARETLEKAMMSEFSTYSEKVYAEAKKQILGNEEEKAQAEESELAALQNELELKDKEIASLHAQINQLLEQLNTKKLNESDIQPQATVQPVQQQVPQQNKEENINQLADPTAPISAHQQYSNELKEDAYTNYSDFDEYADIAPQEVEIDVDDDNDTNDDDGDDVVLFNTNLLENNKVKLPTEYKPAQNPAKRRGRPKKPAAEQVKAEPKRRGRPRKEETSNVKPEQTSQPAKRRGRPAKVVETQPNAQPKAKRGRPKKQTDVAKVEQTATPSTKKGRGRPKKQAVNQSAVKQTKQATNVEKSKPQANRPAKKVVEKQTAKPAKQERPAKQEKPAQAKATRGRPKKAQEVVQTENKPTQAQQKPAKATQPKQTKPAKQEQPAKPAKAEKPAKPDKAEKPAKPAKQEQPAKAEKPTQAKATRGRPKKAQEVVQAESKPTAPKEDYKLFADVQPETRPEGSDIDAYLNQINEEIKKEHQKIQETQKVLAKKSRIKKN